MMNMIHVKDLIFKKSMKHNGESTEMLILMNFLKPSISHFHKMKTTTPLVVIYTVIYVPSLKMAQLKHFILTILPSRLLRFKIAVSRKLLSQRNLVETNQLGFFYNKSSALNFKVTSQVLLGSNACDETAVK